MALHSMTGYGRGAATARGIRVEVELSSVNRKQLDIRVNLPRALMALEARVVERVQETVRRGCVGVAIAVHVTAGARRERVHLDLDLARAYREALRRAGRALRLRDDLDLRAVLGLPDVLSCHGVEEDAERVWPPLEAALNRALRRLVAMRAAEGRALAADLRRRCARLRAWLGAIRSLAPRVPQRYRRQLRRRLGAAGVSLAPHDPALLRELALFADRSDISEEITRLESHLQQAFGLLRTTEAAGRTLDFLAQEMFREINTIGSKANDVTVTRHVIRFKTELERVREQVQNVE
jgi:uncharacterized protein (TIGR00255 family)